MCRGGYKILKSGADGMSGGRPKRNAKKPIANAEGDDSGSGSAATGSGGAAAEDASGADLKTRQPSKSPAANGRTRSVNKRKASAGGGGGGSGGSGGSGTVQFIMDDDSDDDPEDGDYRARGELSQSARAKKARATKRVKRTGLAADAAEERLRKAKADATAPPAAPVTTAPLPAASVSVDAVAPPTLTTATSTDEQTLRADHELALRMAREEEAGEEGVAIVAIANGTRRRPGTGVRGGRGSRNVRLPNGDVIRPPSNTTTSRRRSANRPAAAAAEVIDDAEPDTGAAGTGAGTGAGNGGGSGSSGSVAAGAGSGSGDGALRPHEQLQLNAARHTPAQRLHLILSGTQHIGKTTKEQRSALDKYGLMQRNMEIQAEQLWLDGEYDKNLPAAQDNAPNWEAQTLAVDKLQDDLSDESDEIEQLLVEKFGLEGASRFLMDPTVLEARELGKVLGADHGTDLARAADKEREAIASAAGSSSAAAAVAVDDSDDDSEKPSDDSSADAAPAPTAAGSAPRKSRMSKADLEVERKLDIAQKEIKKQFVHSLLSSSRLFSGSEFAAVLCGV